MRCHNSVVMTRQSRPLNSAESLELVLSWSDGLRFCPLVSGFASMSAPLIDLALHFRKFVSLQHEPKARDVITLVKKTFFRTSIVRNFIPRGVKIRISARKACVKPHLRTRSDIKTIMHAITHVLNVLTAEAQSAEVQQIKRRRLSIFKLN